MRHDGLQRLIIRFGLHKYGQTPCRGMRRDQKPALSFPETQSQPYLLSKWQLFVTVNDIDGRFFDRPAFELRNKTGVPFPKLSRQRPLTVVQNNVIGVVFMSFKIWHKYCQESRFSGPVTTDNLRSIIWFSQRGIQFRKKPVVAVTTRNTHTPKKIGNSSGCNVSRGERIVFHINTLNTKITIKIILILPGDVANTQAGWKILHNTVGVQAGNFEWDSILP